MFWLGLGCVGHSYLEVAVLSILFHAVILMDFPSPVLISDIQMAFINSLHIFSSSITLPSRPSLRGSSMIEESFSLWISRFTVFASSTKL